MSTALNQTNIDHAAIRVAVELLSKSTNAQDLCRRVAHSDAMDGNCHGVAVYLLNQKSMLVEVANYGKVFEFAVDEISAWDDTVLAKSIRSRKVMFEQNDDCLIAALPIQHAEVITGAVMFNLAKTAPVLEVPEDLSVMLSSLGGMFMENKGLSLKGPTNGNGFVSDDEPVSIQELTSRQVKIIKLIAEGMTNAEIAKVVLLSESTVRQETIRIFRILKCHSRSEAIVKARATGIISEISESAPPPPQLAR